MTGKEKCEILKSIRVRLAEVNSIPYSPHSCNNTGDCYGTCCACDAESQSLLSTMQEMEKKFKENSFDFEDYIFTIRFLSVSIRNGVQ